MAEPTPAAPRMAAGYGVPSDASGAELVPWSWAVERLEAARNYWICTTRADGRPHAVPVWGLWLDDAVWLATSRESQKARNLAQNRALVVHVESGDETVILEGDAEEARGRAALERLVEPYAAKYDHRMDPGDEETAWFVLRPRVAHTWRERDFPRSATRWVFG
jgi:hypothetical protein